MTTIAWDGRYVAADSLQGGRDYDSSVPATKLVLAGERVYAICGYFAWFQAWIKWHENGADPANTPVCKLPQSETTFIVFEDGGCFTFDLEMPYADISHPGEALGSGRKFAMGAMAAGLNAEQAVRVAIKLDPHSGGPVQVIDLYGLGKQEQAA